MAKRLDIMRIICGKAKGKRLFAPKGRGTRPTADRVKESVFNMLMRPWEDRRVLDLFSGTGSLGLEAVSRGAREVVFVENAESALNVLRRNVSLCGFDSSVTILAMPVARGLALLERRRESFHVIFADPPYGKGWVMETIRVILAHRLLSHEGVLVMEHAPDESAPETIENLIRFAQRTYGDTSISFFGFEGPGNGRKIDQTERPTSSSKRCVLC